MWKFAYLIWILFNNLIKFEKASILFYSLVIVPYGDVRSITGISKPTVKFTDICNSDISNGLYLTKNLQSFNNMEFVTIGSMTKSFILELFLYKLYKTFLKRVLVSSPLVFTFYIIIEIFYSKFNTTFLHYANCFFIFFAFFLQLLTILIKFPAFGCTFS